MDQIKSNRKEKNNQDNNLFFFIVYPFNSTSIVATFWTKNRLKFVKKKNLKRKIFFIWKFCWIFRWWITSMVVNSIHQVDLRWHLIGQCTSCVMQMFVVWQGLKREREKTPPLIIISSSKHSYFPFNHVIGNCGKENETKRNDDIINNKSTKIFSSSFT